MTSLSSFKLSFLIQLQWGLGFIMSLGYDKTLKPQQTSFQVNISAILLFKETLQYSNKWLYYNFLIIKVSLPISVFDSFFDSTDLNSGRYTW
jgi:hypothetical protein